MQGVLSPLFLPSYCSDPLHRKHRLICKQFSFLFPLAPGKHGICHDSLLLLKLYCPPNKTIDMGPYISYLFPSIMHHPCFTCNSCHKKELFIIRFSELLHQLSPKALEQKLKCQNLYSPPSHRTMALFIKASVSQSYNNVLQKLPQKGTLFLPVPKPRRSICHFT